MSEPRPRMTHELKTWPEFFGQTRNGRKKFEFRRNDRDFRVGDQLLLREWNPTVADAHFSHTSDQDEADSVGYTGREVLVRVDYVMDWETAESLAGDSTFCPMSQDYVIMSISHVN